MLELKGIKKVYPAGNNSVEALKGIDLEFRKSEFVSILGPSGCGKTTMLNIIGGLDGYTEGDLIINGISTEKYKDRDWDSYRNHSIGFVFQSYNLIPHQSVLQNVELALTLSGVSKKERRERAKAALEQVGLGDQLSKKPGEMSGGQMQRVAIARALVNNPDIILADEPTGALDTKTSVQVMEILRSISKDRLIIMVTHNPDLAEEYSTRIINMLDGVITHDSKPITDEERAAEKERIEKYNEEKAKAKKREKMPSMSFATSFMLSLKNLFTKKGRTTLTAFAGSIGIIGIALILSVSQGMTAFINSFQESTLSAYPITLEASSVQLSSLIEAFMDVGDGSEKHGKDAVYKASALYDMINAMQNLEETENDLKSFNEFLLSEMKDENSKLYKAINGIQYSYDLNMQIYTANDDGKIVHADLEKIIGDFMLEYLGMDMTMMNSMSGANSPMASMSSMSMTRKLWQELLPGKDGATINELIYDQYELAYGDWPNAYDEIVLVVDENNELNDVTLYALGLISDAEMDTLANAAINGTELGSKDKSWSYKEICSREFKTILNADCYHYDEATGKYTDLRETEAGLRYLYQSALPLRVTGIIRPKEDATAQMLTGNICYTTHLTKYLIEEAKDSEIIAAQIESTEKDIITGLPFYYSQSTVKETDKIQRVRDYVATLDENGKAMFYTKAVATPTRAYLDEKVDKEISGLDREGMIALIAGFNGTSPEELSATMAAVTDSTLKEMLSEMLRAQITYDYSAAELAKLEGMDNVALANAFDKAYKNYSDEQLVSYYDAIVIIEEKSAKFKEYVATLDDKGKADLYVTVNSIPTDAIIREELSAAVAGVTTDQMKEYLITAISSQMGMSAADITEYLDKMTEQEIYTTYSYAKTEEIKIAYPQKKAAEIRAMWSDSELCAKFNEESVLYTSAQCAEFYDNAIEFSESTYEDNLLSMGYIDMDYPASINLYASSFENKDIITDAIAAYNKSVDELKQIQYTDYFGIMMSSITTIIDAITYVLIAFVAISLVVSSIMIGVITLISVQERTKEIGILRAIGASKRNVSRMFNAETMIVGLCAGLIGVIVTFILCIPINIILHALTGISNLNAFLPIGAAVILVVISVLLTLISGLIPSRSAAKKDPVVALRTE